MGAIFQGQTHPLVLPFFGGASRSDHILRDERHDSVDESSSPEFQEEFPMILQIPDFSAEWVDSQQQEAALSEEQLVQEPASSATHLPQVTPILPELPILLGHMDLGDALGQSLPNLRPREEILALRRRRRAQTVTITSSQMLAEALASEGDDEHVLRPPRVILTTPQGTHSMCLPQDRETRSRYVQAGLPAGPTLPSNESCAVCLEEFQTGDHVQLMANCKHVFHATCIKTLLRTQIPSCMTCDPHVPCPLCRGPLVAASVSQIPRRERRRAITLNSTWFSADLQNSEPDAGPNEDEDTIPTKSTVADSIRQMSNTLLRRAGTAPLEQSNKPTLDVVQRAASTHLEDLKGDRDTHRAAEDA